MTTKSEGVSPVDRLAEAIDNMKKREMDLLLCIGETEIELPDSVLEELEKMLAARAQFLARLVFLAECQERANYIFSNTLKSNPESAAALAQEVKYFIGDDDE